MNMNKFPIMIPEAEAEGDDLIVNAPFDGRAIAGLRESGLATGGIPYTMEDMQIKKMLVLRSKEL